MDASCDTRRIISLKRSVGFSIRRNDSAPFIRRARRFAANIPTQKDADITTSSHRSDADSAIPNSFRPHEMRESISPARSAAFDILNRVERENAYASVLISSLAESDLSREDRALAQEIVLGVLRWRLSLDALIERYSQRSVKRLDVEVLIALRMGLYQIRKLTRVPESAAVNESVKLVKRARVASAAPLVNAVLRKAAKRTDESASDGIADPLDAEAVELSHPRWMLERWSRAFGSDETKLLAVANNSAASIAFRINALRAPVETVLSVLSGEGVRFRESRIAAGAYLVEGGPPEVVIDAARVG